MRSQYSKGGTETEFLTPLASMKQTKSEEPTLMDKHVVIITLPSPKAASDVEQIEPDILPLMDKPVTDKQKDVLICLKKLVLDNPDQKLIMSQKVMGEFPVSKYRPEGYLDALTAHYEALHTEKYDTDATVAYSSSDETISYWPLDKAGQIHMFPCVVPQANIEQKPK